MYLINFNTRLTLINKVGMTLGDEYKLFLVEFQVYL
jgi:hypothetical protein